MQNECEELGTGENGTTCLTFFGIEMDMLIGELYLPQDKLANLQQDMTHWLSWKTCQWQELESLLRTLHYAAHDIPPGRSFIGKIIELLREPRRPYYHIHLNRHFSC